MYTLRDIEGRVAALEEDAEREIAAGEKLPFTATIIPELRWLLDQSKAARVKAKVKTSEPAIDELDEEVAKLERRFGQAIKGGKFIFLHSDVIVKFRLLCEQLRADRKRAKIAEVEEFEEAVA